MHSTFCSAARYRIRLGIVYHGVHEDYMELTHHGRLSRYVLEHVLDFDPTRRRMSVIVRDEDGLLMFI